MNKISSWQPTIIVLIVMITICFLTYLSLRCDKIENTSKTKESNKTVKKDKIQNDRQVIIYSPIIILKENNKTVGTMYEDKILKKLKDIRNGQFSIYNNIKKKQNSAFIVIKNKNINTLK